MGLLSIRAAESICAQFIPEESDIPLTPSSAFGSERNVKEVAVFWNC
jgi:hypothetical protein